MALLILPVLYLGLKRHCDTLVHAVSCDGNGVPRYEKQGRRGCSPLWAASLLITLL